MMKFTRARRWRFASPLLVAALGVCLLTAATPLPTPRFPEATTRQLGNGARLILQSVPGTPLVGASLFLPGGAADQPADQAGIAAVAADVVLHSPADQGRSPLDVVKAAGGTLSFTLEPRDTRFDVESRAGDLPKILHALVAALNHPDAKQFDAARSRAATAAEDSAKNPVAVVLGMIRQVEYSDTGFASLDVGRPNSLATLSASTTLAFIAAHARGSGTILSVSGGLSGATLDAAQAELSGLASGAAPAHAAAPKAVTRSHQVVAHRSVSAPWVGIGYVAPAEFSKEFPAMLVIAALLGPGGDPNALSLSSQAPLPDDYLGTYYQYEAQPGELIIFLNGSGGSTIDRSIQELQLAIARLRSQPLPASLVDRGRRLAIGQYYMSVTTMPEAAWLLGHAAMSPQGIAYAAALPRAIAAVTPADIQRVARTYLTHETIGVVLPTNT